MNQTTTPAALDLDTIRAVFMRNGFTIKEGQADLKPYVYAAALELIDLARRSPSAAGSEQNERALTLTQFEPIASSWDKCHYDGIDIGESLRHDFKRLAQQAAPEKAEHKDLQRYLDWYKSAATREEARNAKACIESLLREAAPEALAMSQPQAPMYQPGAQPVAAAPAETVAQVDLENGCWLDVEAHEVPSWEVRKFKTRTLFAAPAAPVAQVLPLELMGVREEIEAGSGFWHSCSGCHESNEGYPTGPHSVVFGCALGNGCSECGGLGAVWDDTDYEAMAKEDAAEVAQATTASASDAEFLSKRLARVAKLVGAHIPEHFTHKQISEVAGTILGEIARRLETSRASAPSREAAPSGMPFALMVARADVNEIGAWGAQQYEDGRRAALAQQGAAQGAAANAGGLPPLPPKMGTIYSGNYWSGFPNANPPGAPLAEFITMGQATEFGHACYAAGRESADKAPATSAGASQGQAGEDDARDAERGKWLIERGFKYANVDMASDGDGDIVIFHPRFYIPEPAGMSYEDGEWTVEDIRAAIDAAIAATTTKGGAV